MRVVRVRYWGVIRGEETTYLREDRNVEVLSGRARSYVVDSHTPVRRPRAVVGDLGYLFSMY